MCARLIITDTAPDLAAMFDVEHEGQDLPEPSWAVEPPQQVPVVLESAKSGSVLRRLESARWSLVPAFANRLASTPPTFTAPSETVGGAPSFAPSLVARRALVPVTGYVEWHTDGADRTPYFVYSDDGLPLALAGLYAWWRNPALADDDPARWLLSATILTREATGRLRTIDERMPVVLPEEAWDQWLDPHTPADQDFVDAAVAASDDAAAGLGFHEVAPAGTGPESIEPVRS